MPEARTLACKPDRSRQNVPGSQRQQIEVVHEARRCHGHGVSSLGASTFFFYIFRIPRRAIVRYDRTTLPLAKYSEDVNVRSDLRTSADPFYRTSPSRRFFFNFIFNRAFVVSLKGKKRKKKKQKKHRVVSRTTRRRTSYLFIHLSAYDGSWLFFFFFNQHYYRIAISTPRHEMRAIYAFPLPPPALSSAGVSDFFPVRCPCRTHHGPVSAANGSFVARSTGACAAASSLSEPRATTAAAAATPRTDAYIRNAGDTAPKGGSGARTSAAARSVTPRGVLINRATRGIACHEIPFV